MNKFSIMVITMTIVTYNQIKPILLKHCSSCHNENWSDKNWLNEKVAKENATKIKQRVWITKEMPPGNFTGMQENERELIKNWVDGGAK